MSERALKFVLGFHNYCGILNLEYKNGRFFRSNLFAILNIIRIAILIIIGVCVKTNKDFRSTVLRKELATLENFSIFTQILMNFALVTNVILYLFLNIICLWKRGQILNLFNKCIEFTLEEQLQKKFRNISTRNSLLILIYLFLCFFAQLITQMKYSVSSIIVSFILTHPFFVMLNFLCFMKNSEIFFVLLLEQFKNDLEKFSLKNYFDEQFSQKLIRKYQNIYELNKEYRKVFGVQITFMTCCINILLTIQVNKSRSDCLY